MGEHLVVARFFYVENLSLEREDGLEAAITSLFGGAAGGLSFHEEEFAAVGIALGAVGEFAGKAAGIKRAFAAGEVAGLARRFAGAGSVDGFVDDLFRDRRILFKERAEAF